MRRLPLLLLVFLPFLGCDDGPGGPGQLTGSVLTPGPVLGGAVLEVVGKGVTGFSGAGSTRVFYSPTDVEDTYRVVLISSTPGDLRFLISVDDVKGKKPMATVMKLASGENLPLPATADYEVAITR